MKVVASSGGVRRSLAGLAVAAWTAGVVPGCGLDDQPSEDIQSIGSPIIGGTTISVATRRALGLVDFGCSGALMNRDWVLTAAHCIAWQFPQSMIFQAPRTDGSLDWRFGSYAVQVGSTDMAMVRLQPGQLGNMWPNVSHPVTTTTKASWVGQNLTCYGQGATMYDPDGAGVIAGGIWKSLTKQIVSVTSDPTYGDAYRVVAVGNPGTEVYSWGDSGGNCIASNGQVVAVESSGGCTAWQGQGQPGDVGCNSTNAISQRDNLLRATADYRNYMTQALTRAGTTFQPLTLTGGWTPAPFGTNLPGANNTSGIITLRGAMQTSGTDPNAFTLPFDLRPGRDVHIPISLCGATKGRLYITQLGVASVEAEGGGWSNAQCFTSLDGASFAFSGFDTTDLTLTNGWTNAPFSTRSAAARVLNGIVRLQGAIASGSTTAPFTLPAGFRPSADVYVPVDLCNTSKGRLIIQSNGTVNIETFGAFSDAQCFTSLEGAWFAIGAGGFSTLTLQNGWAATSFGTRNPAVKNDGGIIRFQGAMRTSATNPVAFTLPSSMRPATPVYAPVDLCSAQKGWLFIQPNGTVEVQAPSNAFSAAQCFTSLEGTSFGI